MAVVIDLDKPNGAALVMNKVKEALNQKKKIIGFELLRQLAYNTPVLTGRLRQGYFPSISVESSEVPPEGVYSFPDLVSRGMQAWSSAQLTDTLVITNNVPYGVMVNNGTAKIAPRHFVERAINITIDALG